MGGTLSPLVGTGQLYPGSVCGGSGMLKNVTRHICSPYVSPDGSVDGDLEEREEKRPH